MKKIREAECEKREKASDRQTCWVYVLECGDGSYYTGWTNDLARRVRSHQAGKGGKYTRSRLPVKLIKKWRAKSRSLAMGKEAIFKSLSRREKRIRLGLGPRSGRRNTGKRSSPLGGGHGGKFLEKK